MTPRTQTATKNLREGIKKMEKTMTTAAQVRRDFRLGRPLKTETMEPLDPRVVWQRATAALANFRARMTAAKLNPAHAEALIVYVDSPDSNVLHRLLLESPCESPEKLQGAALKKLAGTYALGMVFTQFDEQTKQQATFPYQFMPLSERGITVLRQAATIEHEAISLTKTAN